MRAPRVWAAEEQSSRLEVLGGLFFLEGRVISV
jgi:hypothetical protein